MDREIGNTVNFNLMLEHNYVKIKLFYHILSRAYKSYFYEK